MNFVDPNTLRQNTVKRQPLRIPFIPVPNTQKVNQPQTTPVYPQKQEVKMLWTYLTEYVGILAVVVIILCAVTVSGIMSLDSRILSLNDNSDIIDMIDSVNTNLTGVEGRLDTKILATTTNVGTVQTTVNTISTNLATVQSNILLLGGSKEIMESINSTIVNILYNLETWKGSPYELYDPTYDKMISFIENDTTDAVPYDADTFICTDFAITVNDNAELQGIRCAVVEVRYNRTVLNTTTNTTEDVTGAHSMIGFDTLDQGMIYIEPQNDIIQTNITIGGFFSIYPDCTINRIFMYW